ncbi:MAG: GGDEF domain-containing protein [Arcobacteraceae bacterium]
MKKRIIVQFSIMIICIAIVITSMIAYNLRETGLSSSINTAQSISEVVKNGLTSHMVNGNMDQRDTFINSISNMSNVKKLWFVRANAVTEQYGVGRENEEIKDQIDNQVIRSGKMEYKLYENFITNETTMRVTIPYLANTEGSVNCLNCHNVKYGETLGAVSIVLDIQDLKEVGIQSIYILIAITFLSMFFVIFVTSNILNPYLQLFEKIAVSIKEAINGRFIQVKKPHKLSSDMILFTDDFNMLLTSYKATFDDIDKKLKYFIGHTTSKENKTPLDESKLIITNLSNLYQFKKEIEQDQTKEEIFDRLVQVLKNQFHQKNFTIYQTNLKEDSREVVSQVGTLNFCCPSHMSNPSLCRSARTNNDVVSVEFHNPCPCFTSNDYFYYCTSTNINKNTIIVINFVLETKEELLFVKDNISFIKSYINEAAPSIAVKILLQALKDSAFRDGLTGLYNRKFLEEYIKKALPQAIRDNKKLAVLMLDMDHFKSVNDEYGHDIGDVVLKELGYILIQNVRESDLVIRFGGEEFIVILSNIDNTESALAVANKIREQIAQNEIDVYAGTKLRKTVSIGLAVFPDDGKTFDTVCKNADIALYEAKNKGRNQVVVFNESQVSSIDLF